MRKAHNNCINLTAGAVRFFKFRNPQQVFWFMKICAPLACGRLAWHKERSWRNRCWKSALSFTTGRRDGRGQPEDIQYGDKIVSNFRPFIEDLILKDYKDKTVKKHIDNLWLLGGELIREINMDPELRNKGALDLLLEFIGTDGGPYCRHLDNDEELKSFDSTCKKLFKFYQLTNR